MSAVLPQKSRGTPVEPRGIYMPASDALFHEKKPKPRLKIILAQTFQSNACCVCLVPLRFGNITWSIILFIFTLR